MGGVRGVGCVSARTEGGSRHCGPEGVAPSCGGGCVTLLLLDEVDVMLMWGRPPRQKGLGSRHALGCVHCRVCSSGFSSSPSTCCSAEAVAPAGSRGKMTFPRARACPNPHASGW